MSTALLPNRGPRLVLAITSALEALEAGDTRLVVQTLVGALEDVRVADPLGRRVTCECGVGPLWPGELDDHRRRKHESLPARFSPRPIVDRAEGVQLAA
jgi:hypothetical protein